MSRRSCVGWLVLALGLTACAAMPQALPAPTTVLAMPTPTLSPSPSPKLNQVSPAPTAASVPLKSPALDQARADLACRLNVAADQIEVVSVVASEAPLQSSCQPVDSSAPSIPAFVMGQDITLAYVGQTYVYRAQAGRLMLCEGTAPTPGWPAQADAAVRAAINDLASKRPLAPESVQVVSVEAIDWSDTSLGCPQPGMFYAQVIVQGCRIVLSAGGQQVEYHSDMKGRVVTCSPRINPRSANDVSARAILDLASRLEISSDSVTVERVELDEFPAGGLGCSQPGQPPRAIPAIISGQRIILRAADKVYEYRASGNELIYCGVR